MGDIRVFETMAWADGLRNIVIRYAAGLLRGADQFHLFKGSTIRQATVSEHRGAARG